MPGLEDTAAAFADELVETDRQGVVITTATLAATLDQNPALIKIIADALYMVKEIGNNKNDPGFAGINFARGTIK